MHAKTFLAITAMHMHRLASIGNVRDLVHIHLFEAFSRDISP